MHIATDWPIAEEALKGDAHIEAPESADRTLMRERNIELTKRQIGESVGGDTVLIHTINTIEELDRTANTLTKRLREWWKLHWPGAEHDSRDHTVFLEKANAQLEPDALVGGALLPQEREILASQLEAVRALHAQREKLKGFLDEQMQKSAPNIACVAGPMIGAKLIALAGSLRRLSMMPAGTVQLLGAETALFRHLRDRKARPPKHGVIFNHPILQRAHQKKRGKVARALADSIAIAAKLDFFGGEFLGEKLLSKVEEASR